MSDILQVASFDGSSVILLDNDASFEVGNYLGGGAAGTVYEAEYSKTRENFALKILNHLGYKLAPSAMLKRCTIITKGMNYDVASELANAPIMKEHIWWLLNGSTRQYLAAYYSERERCLKELTLKQCVYIWGMDHDCSTGSNAIDNVDVVQTADSRNYIPTMPPKFVDFVKRRDRICREITNMRKISNHKNVIHLKAVLELVEDTSSRIFLVMELANGGELFDRIKLDCGTREELAKSFFRQLLDGVRHCHEQGICHRDLKPENLLLTDTTESGTVLKIADFGFSTRFAMAADDETNMEEWAASSPSFSAMSDPANMGIYLQQVGTPNELRTLTSVVGSPFYVAPEILQSKGYSGPKADVYSMGVILYAMLAGSLPFGQELAACKRFKAFRKWIDALPIRSAIDLHILNDVSLDYPGWLFPDKFSVEAKGLIVAMLYPNPEIRISVQEAQKHSWCYEVPAIPPISIVGAQEEASDMEIPPAADIVYTMSDAQMGEWSGSAQDEDIFAMEEDVESKRATAVVFPSPPPSVQKETQIPHPFTIQPETTSATWNTSSPASMHFVGTPSSFTSRGLYMANAAPPPVAPVNLVHAQADILEEGIIAGFDKISIRPPVAVSRGFSDESSEAPTSPGNYSRQSSTSSIGSNPPSFSDLVKRSTRFITAVPAADVLDKLLCVLESCQAEKIITAVGFISRVELIVENYRIEVWGSEDSGPPLMALQLYQMPMVSQSPQSSPGRLSAFKESGTLYLVEFIRMHKVDMFTFKRFYQWVRKEVGELVKKDYAIESFTAGSPIMFVDRNKS